MINRLPCPVGRSESVVSDELGLRTAAITVTLSRARYLLTRARPIPEIVKLNCARGQISSGLPLLAPEINMVDMICVL
jgi:hypothetical protein